MKLTVIVPVFNESRTIGQIIDRIVQAPLPPGFEKEIVVVDDFSADGTRGMLDELKRKHKFQVILHEKNRGKGAAMRTGLAAATGEFAVIQDADLEYDPNEYTKLLEPLLSGQAEIVYGSRYMNKKQSDLFSVNYFANRILTFISNLFNGQRLTDMETCHKMYTKNAYTKIAPLLRSERFDIEPEITSSAARCGFSIIEVPISYEPRTAREGKKIKWHDGIPAVWAIARFGIRGLWRVRQWQVMLIISLAVLVLLFGAFQGPNILGDTPTYVQSIEVLNGAQPTADFIPNRLLTTFLGLELINLLSHIFGGIYPAWFVLNCSLYFLACIFFFKILSRMLKNEQAAYFGTMFLAANYGFLIFGLNYLMDVGGWSFYIFALYFLWRYSVSKKTSHILWSAAMVGLGGLFKEYAFLAALAIAMVLILENGQRLGALAKKAALTAFIALVPIVVLYSCVYSYFGYTYADWFGSNSVHYVYASRMIEYIKSLGSLVNVLALAFIAGLWVILRHWRDVGREARVFLFSLLVSIIPIFFWPAITQRIMTVTIPFIAIVSAFFFRRQKNKWPVFAALLAIYVLATFLMDSVVLKAVNLPF